MNAVSAAGTGVNGAPANTTGATAASPSQSATSSLLAGVLAIDGEGYPAGGAQPEEQTNGEGKQTAGAGVPEGNESGAEGEEGTQDGAQTGGEEGGDDDGNGSGDGRNADVGTGSDDPEAKLTEEEKAELPDWVMPRIGKLTKQRETLKEQAAKVPDLEAKLAELEGRVKATAPVVLAPTPQDPLSDVADFNSLQSAEQHYRELKRWATLHKDGASDVPVGKGANGEPQTRDFTAKEVAQMLVEADEALANVPRRAAYLQQLQATEQIAREDYPDLFKAGTAEAKEFTDVLTVIPELTRMPNYPLLIAFAIEGRKAYNARLAEKNGNGAAAPQQQSNKPKVNPKVAPFLQKQPPIAPAAPGGRGAPAPSTREAAKQEVTKAKERVIQEGGEDAEVDFVGALLNSQRKPSGTALVAA